MKALAICILVGVALLGGANCVEAAHKCAIAWMMANKAVTPVSARWFWRAWVTVWAAILCAGLAGWMLGQPA